MRGHRAFPQFPQFLNSRIMQLKNDESLKNISCFRKQNTSKRTSSQWQNQTGFANPTALLHVKRKWRFWGTSWQCINYFLMEAFKEYLSASDYFLHIISLKNKQECFINIKTQGTADRVTKTGQKKRVRFTLLHNLWYYYYLSRENQRAVF